MCDPMTIAGLAMSVGGSAMQSRNADKVNQRNFRDAQTAQSNTFNSQRDARSTERDRQAKIRQESMELFNQNLADVGGPGTRGVEPERETARTQRLVTAAGTNAPASAFAAPPASAPNIVKDAYDAANAKSVAGSDARARALAKLNSFTSGQFDRSLGRTRTGSKQGALSDISRGSAGVLPLEMDAARQTPTQTIGRANPLFDIATGTGQLLTLGGLNGKGFGDIARLFGGGSNNVYGMPNASYRTLQGAIS